jgi:hypothetical protein
MTFPRWLIAVALAAAPGLAQAQEGSGCGGFKWPLDAERAALVRADKPSLANGGPLAYNVALTLELQPLAGAGLPKAPERAPKSPQAFAGHFTLAAPPKPGVFTGATGCDGARKSVRFDLPSRPLALQFSGVKDDRISVIVSPDQ